MHKISSSFTVFDFTCLQSNRVIFVFFLFLSFSFSVMSWNFKFICSRCPDKKNREGHEN